MAFFSSVTRSLLLATISLTLIDLSQGLSCYNCIGPNDGRNVVTPKDAPESCNRKSAVELGHYLPCKDKVQIQVDAQCGKIKTQYEDGMVTRWKCIEGKIVGQLAGKMVDGWKCDDSFPPTAGDPKRIVSQTFCICNGDDCNAPPNVKEDNYPFEDIEKEKKDLEEEKRKVGELPDETSGSGSLVTCWRMIFAVAALRVGLALF